MLVVSGKVARKTTPTRTAVKMSRRIPEFEASESYTPADNEINSATRDSYAA